MSDSNRVQLRYYEESNWGVTAASRTMVELRHTGEALGYNIDYITSAEIRSDRQITDSIQAGADANGGIDFELSYASFDDFLEGALMSDWSADLGISVATFDVSTAGTITCSTDPLGDISAGQWIKIAGLVTSSGANNGYYLVTAAAAGAITVSPVPSADEVDSGTMTISGSMLRNGSTEHSYAIERRLEDLDPDVFFAFAGMMVNSVSMSVQANSILTGAFDFIGKSATVATGAMSTGSLTAANTNKVLNAVANVANILEDNAAVATCLIRGVDFSVNNNLRGLDSIGQLGNCDIGIGQCDVTGSLEVYFQNKDLYAKYIAGTETSLSFRAADASGNAYIVTFHRIKFSADTVNTPGANSDIMESISWTSLRDETYDCQVQIDKFAGS